MTNDNRHDHEELQMRTPVGAGAEAFSAVSSALLTGELHRWAGVRLPTPGFVAGQQIRLSARLGPVPIIAPVEVTRLEAGEARTVLAYRALPGHPEIGTEEFAVELHASGEVDFVLSVESRPGPWWARAAAPIARPVQRNFTVRYLLAARHFGTTR